MENFESYVQTKTCHYKYARGRMAVTGREFHDYDEIVLFPEGNVQLISKNIHMVLCPGSLVLIPKEHFHQFIPTDVGQYLRCIFGFWETSRLRELIREVMEDVTVLPLPPETAVALYRTLNQTALSGLSQGEKQLLLDSALPQLLLTLKLFTADGIRNGPGISPMISRALAYIDGHFSDKIELPDIALQLNVSESTLSHRFRQELNISVYRYISEKRLSAVRQHVAKGESLAAAAEKSGFRDYSGFYRLYKNRYHKYPSAIHQFPEAEE